MPENNDPFGRYLALLDESQEGIKFEQNAGDAEDPLGAPVYIKDDVLALRAFAESMVEHKVGQEMTTLPFNNDPIVAAKFVATEIARLSLDDGGNAGERPVPLLVSLGAPPFPEAGKPSPLAAYLQAGLGEWGEAFTHCIDPKILKTVADSRRIILVIHGNSSFDTDFDHDGPALQHLLKGDPRASIIASDAHHYGYLERTMSGEA